MADREGVVAPVLGRDGRGRLAPAAGGLRAVQQAVLRSFAATGQPPEAAVLERAAAPSGAGAGEVLAALAREDFLTLDGEGAIRAAYPFSAVPTPHRVGIGGGPEVYAMCAVDALGIPAMLGADAVISSADPLSGAPVTVTFTAGRARWEPRRSVVFLGQHCCEGPAAEVSCGVVSFFTGRGSARAWARANADVTGKVAGQAQAEELGREIFGPLLGG